MLQVMAWCWIIVTQIPEQNMRLQAVQAISHDKYGLSYEIMDDMFEDKRTQKGWYDKKLDQKLRSHGVMPSDGMGYHWL